MRLPKMTQFAHDILQRVIVKGDIVIDATAGNGYDTLFLAQLVGDHGKVYAFDIQKEAIRTTSGRIAEAGLSNVELIHDSHENMHHYVNERVKAVVFNLGYLPGSDKKITTACETSVVAIRQSLELVSNGGLVVIVVYPGHPEGKLEQQAIDPWVDQLDEQQFQVIKIQIVNQTNNPPYVIAIQRKN